MEDVLQNLDVTYKYSMSASTLLADDTHLVELAQAHGYDLDFLRRHSGSTWVKDFGVLHREVPNPMTCPAGAASASPTGTPQPSGTNKTPARGNGVTSSQTPPPSAGTLDPTTLGSIEDLRKDGSRLVFAVDTEFYYPNGPAHERLVLTWQFCFALPGDDGVLHEVVFYSVRGNRLTLEQALAYLLERFSLASAMGKAGMTSCGDRGFEYRRTRRWVVPTHDTKGALWEDRKYHPKDWASCDTLADARARCADPDFRAAYGELSRRHSKPTLVRLDKRSSDYRSLAGYVNDYDAYYAGDARVPVTVLCHFGRADLTAFGLGRYDVDVLRMTSQVQRGHVSLENFRMVASLPVRYGHFYPFEVQVRDTMCFAPAKKRSLGLLGESVGIPKVALPPGFSKDRMDELLAGDVVRFLEYAVQDSLITLVYAATLFGLNRDMPVTVSSAGAAAVRKTIRAVFGLKSVAEFDEWFMGLKTVRKGKTRCRKSRSLKQERDLKPINDDCGLVQEAARHSYKGGLNMCQTVGWVPGRTWDLDLMSAYPTAMCCVYDVDWGAERVIVQEWRDRWLDPSDLPDDPFLPMFFYVDDFKFPKGSKYTCLPQNIEGKLVYTRKLGDRDGTYVTGVEVWLALKMGASVHVRRGYRAAVRIGDDGEPTHSLYHAVARLVRDRGIVKRHLEAQPELEVFEKLLKQVVNSIYGKTAQGVLEKQSWDAFKERMVDIGSSVITSPAHCSMTTAIVRCILIAAMTELDAKGVRSYSCTTDGFITEADEATVNGLGLFGLADRLRDARVRLSGDPKVWEWKHRQDGFCNIATRGNCAPELGGVCAHNGYSTPFEHDSRGDRLNFLHHVLCRTGRVETKHLAFIGHRALSGKEGREDFRQMDATKEISMDFDMKRRPVESSVHDVTVTLEDRDYVAASVETEPYETPEEFDLWYRKARGCRCLRTAAEWAVLFLKVRNKLKGNQPKRRIRDVEWSRILTCVMGHRLGVWTIPELGREDTKVDDKLAWINDFNASKRRFKESDWKNCRRQDRQSQMLDRDEVDDLLKAMGAMT